MTLTTVLLLTALLPMAATAGAEATLTVCPTMAEGCDHTSIQDAVDAAAPGTVIHITEGTYSEAISVTTPDLTLQGDGRNVTVLDGTGISRDAVKITADGVTVRSLTVQNYGGNGIFYDGVIGFLVEDVAAIDNGPYGIYAIRSEVGTFRDAWATGHRDSGFYLGEIDSCECLIEDVIAVENLIGYSGTGAGHIVIRDSVWRNNAAGIVPNVLPQEPSPQIRLVIKDNLVESNNNEWASQNWHFSGGIHVPHGLGIVIAGGIDDLVTENVVRDHVFAGIAISFLFTQPSLNQVVDNTVDDNGVDILWDGGGVNNCFEGNTHPDGSPADFDAGILWNTAGTLPDCDTPNAAPPDPQKTAQLATLLGFRCEPDAFVEEALAGGDLLAEPGCHLHAV